MPARWGYDQQVALCSQVPDLQLSRWTSGSSSHSHSAEVDAAPPKVQTWSQMLSGSPGILTIEHWRTRQALGPKLRSQWVWGGAREFRFAASPQVGQPALMAQGPRFEEGCVQYPVGPHPAPRAPGGSAAPSLPRERPKLDGPSEPAEATGWGVARSPCAAALPSASRAACLAEGVCVGGGAPLALPARPPSGRAARREWARRQARAGPWHRRLGGCLGVSLPGFKALSLLPHPGPQCRPPAPCLAAVCGHDRLPLRG